MIQSLFTPYLIYADIVLKLALKSCICRSSGGFAHHSVINYLAPRPASE